MNIEKVKEIKKALEYNKTDHLSYIDEWKCKFVEYADILTLINELESENERLRLERDVLIGKKIVEKQKHDKALIMKIDIQEQLKNRIDELENENVKQLKQFAEKLKEKYGQSCSEYYPLLLELTSEQLDETLNEFIND